MDEEQHQAHFHLKPSFKNTPSVIFWLDRQYHNETTVMSGSHDGNGCCNRRKNNTVVAKVA